MYRVSVALDTEWLNTLQQVHEIVPEHIERYARRELRPFVSQRVDQTLRREPPVRSYPEDYPLEWTSEKQQRAYFVTDGFGAGIPYRRTHEYVQGWHVRGDYTHGLTAIEVYHDDEVVDFVAGRRQQRFHRITGWPNANDTLQVISVELNDRIEAGLPVVLDQAFEELGW